MGPGLGRLERATRYATTTISKITTKGLYMLIGVSGYARAGKDSIADILVAEHGFVRLAFADIMRDMLLAIDPLIPVAGNWPNGQYGVLHLRLASIITKTSWDEAKTLYPEIRRLLQALGTDAGRRYLGENIWVDAALRRWHPGDNVVMSDCRFTNEAAAIKNRAGFMWRVNRPGVGPANSHPSEVALNEWRFDATIPNSGSLAQLAHRVEDALILCRTLVGR